MVNELSVLFIGDIVGTAGMQAITEYLDIFRKKYNAQLIIANGENADKGKGITEKEATQLFELGVHIITTGNHIWENWKSKSLLADNPKILRPYNYPSGNLGRGFTFHNLSEGIVVAVLQLQGRMFLQTIDCPFRIADNAIKYISDKTKIILVDFHAETTAEKISMAWHLDGRVSGIFGTHTHVQTSDACILPNGTGYITDVGMTGPFDSVVGMKKEIALKRFTLQTAHKYEVATEDIKISGVNLVIDISTGLAKSIESFVYPALRTKVE